MRSLKLVCRGHGKISVVWGVLASICDLASPIAPFSLYLLLTMVLVFVISLFFKMIPQLDKKANVYVGDYWYFPFASIMVTLIIIMFLFYSMEKKNPDSTGLLASHFVIFKDIQTDLGLIGKDIKEIKDNTREIAVATKETAQTNKQIETKVTSIDVNITSLKKEKSSDPRKELSNLGVKWNSESFDDALRIRDIKVITLFLEGGMNPTTNLTGGGNAILWLIGKEDPTQYEIFSLLFSHGLDPNYIRNTFTYDKNAPFFLAESAKCFDWAVFCAVLQNGGDKLEAIKYCKKAIYSLRKRINRPYYIWPKYNDIPNELQNTFLDKEILSDQSPDTQTYRIKSYNRSSKYAITDKDLREQDMYRLIIFNRILYSLENSKKLLVESKIVKAEGDDTDASKYINFIKNSNEQQKLIKALVENDFDMLETLVSSGAKLNRVNFADMLIRLNETDGIKYLDNNDAIESDNFITLLPNQILGLSTILKNSNKISLINKYFATPANIQYLGKEIDELSKSSIMNKAKKQELEVEINKKIEHYNSIPVDELFAELDRNYYYVQNISTLYKNSKVPLKYTLYAAIFNGQYNGSLKTTDDLAKLIEDTVRDYYDVVDDLDIEILAYQNIYNILQGKPIVVSKANNNDLINNKDTKPVKLTSRKVEKSIDDTNNEKSSYKKNIRSSDSPSKQSNSQVKVSPKHNNNPNQQIPKYEHSVFISEQLQEMISKLNNVTSENDIVVFLKKYTYMDNRAEIALSNSNVLNTARTFWALGQLSRLSSALKVATQETPEIVDNFKLPSQESCTLFKFSLSGNYSISLVQINAKLYIWNQG